jgi:formylglycine-generating enzyme required for sulfatase activity
LVLIGVGVALSNNQSANSKDPTPTLSPDVPPVNASLEDTWTRPADNAVMVYVPAGEFEMGSPESGGNNNPAHQVFLNNFWIDKHEVTNEKFITFSNEIGDQEESGVTWLNLDKNHAVMIQDGEFRSQNNYENHPVVGVSWYGAAAYCEWVGGRLPTEAEWEYAARGLEEQNYPWSDAFGETNANLCDINCPSGWSSFNYDDGYEMTAPVGSFPSGASWCGAQDMAGNVWEWVADWYDSDYYEISPTDNPTGPDTGKSKVLRGGSWNDSPNRLRCTSRREYYPKGQDNETGFRCARDAE